MGRVNNNVNAQCLPGTIASICYQKDAVQHCSTAEVSFWMLKLQTDAVGEKSISCPNNSEGMKNTPAVALFQQKSKNLTITLFSLFNVMYRLYNRTF